MKCIALVKSGEPCYNLAIKTPATTAAATATNSLVKVIMRYTNSGSYSDHTCYAGTKKTAANEREPPISTLPGFPTHWSNSSKSPNKTPQTHRPF
jgi:hypothetical protein